MNCLPCKESYQEAVTSLPLLLLLQSSKGNLGFAHKTVQQCIVDIHLEASPRERERALHAECLCCLCSFRLSIELQLQRHDCN